MIAVIRSEFIRIWRPTFRYGGIGLMAGFAVMISVFIYTSLGSADQAMQPGGGPVTTVADIAQPGGMLVALGSVGSLAGIVLLSFWAIATASDYDTGLVRILVQSQPSRSKLLGGKILALTPARNHRRRHSLRCHRSGHRGGGSRRLAHRQLAI